MSVIIQTSSNKFFKNVTKSDFDWSITSTGIEANGLGIDIEALVDKPLFADLQSTPSKLVASGPFLRIVPVKKEDDEQIMLIAAAGNKLTCNVETWGAEIVTLGFSTHPEHGNEFSTVHMVVKVTNPKGYVAIPTEKGIQVFFWEGKNFFPKKADFRKWSHKRQKA